MLNANNYAVAVINSVPAYYMMLATSEADP